MPRRTLDVPQISLRTTFAHLPTEDKRRCAILGSAVLLRRVAWRSVKVLGAGSFGLYAGL
jgi:hypothetical protein